MAFYYKPKSLAEVQMEGEGLLAQCASRYMTNGSVAPTSGDLRASLTPIRAGTIVTNIHVGVTGTAAGTVTTIKAGLFDKSGNRLAASDNSTTALNGTNAVATIALATPYTVPATDVYYPAILIVATQMPTLTRINSNTPFHTAVGSGKPVGVTEASQTDVDATATFTATALMYWFGIT